MSDNNKAIPPDNYKNLRKRAEELLQTSRVEMENTPVDDVKKLVHELQVHQIELQTTVENLNETQIELTRSYERFRELYESAPVGYMTIDEHGHILQVNKTIAEMLTISKTDLEKRYLMSLVSEVDRDRIHHFLRDVKTQLQICTADFTFERFPNRDIIYLRVKAVAAAVREGEPLEIKMTFIDITDEKRAREALQDAKMQLEKQASELKNANEELESFVHSISHDLRNPLHAVSTFIQFIKEDSKQSLGPASLELMDQIDQNIIRMKDIIAALLSLTQVNHSDLIFEDVDLTALADEIITQLKK